jgi:hypothetical protein
MRFVRNRLWTAEYYLVNLCGLIVVRGTLFEKHCVD